VGGRSKLHEHALDNTFDVRQHLEVAKAKHSIAFSGQYAITFFVSCAVMSVAVLRSIEFNNEACRVFDKIENV